PPPSWAVSLAQPLDVMNSAANSNDFYIRDFANHFKNHCAMLPSAAIRFKGAKLAGLCRTNCLESTKESRKISKQFKLLVLYPVGIEVHHIVASLTHFLKQSNENCSVKF